MFVCLCVCVCDRERERVEEEMFVWWRERDFFVRVYGRERNKGKEFVCETVCEKDGERETKNRNAVNARSWSRRCLKNNWI
jgi:hypothetical protein